MIIFQKMIYREDLKSNQGIYYIFGDNDKRTGNGGQAKEMRGEKNAIGIRVKKSPNRVGLVYYFDSDYDINIKKIDEDFTTVEKLLKQGEIVICPSDGIGTGLARLKEFAPKTLIYIENKIKELWEKYN